MKKLAYVFALAFAVALTACGEKTTSTNNGGDITTTAPAEPTEPAAVAACACPENECKCNAETNCGACGAENKEACADSPCH